MIYGSFAQYYDELFDEELYLKWQNYVEDNTSKNSKLLDLAGGAGRLGVLLARDGYDVTDADFSEEMLSLASDHATEAGVKLNLVEANMLDLSGLDTYDTVTCFADSLCYLQNIDEVQTVFDQVRQHLKTDGQFLFDIITPYQTDKVYPGFMFNYQSDDDQRFFMWSSFADDDVEHGVIHELSFFDRQENGQYQRLSETHFERSYELSKVKQALHNVGFQKIEVTSEFGTSPIQNDTTRWFFKCQ